MKRAKTKVLGEIGEQNFMSSRAKYVTKSKKYSFKLPLIIVQSFEVVDHLVSFLLSFFIGHLREMEQLSNPNLNQTPAEEILCHPTLIKPLPIL